jgi:hypothetical protein
VAEKLHVAARRLRALDIGEIEITDCAQRFRRRARLEVRRQRIQPCSVIVSFNLRSAWSATSLGARWGLSRNRGLARRPTNFRVIASAAKQSRSEGLSRRDRHGALRRLAMTR